MFNTILSAIILSMSFEGGYIPQAKSLVYQYQTTCDFADDSKSYFVNTTTGVELFGFYTESSYQFFFGYKPFDGTGTPYRGSFDFEVGYKLHKLINHVGLKFVYAHNCSHTVNTFQFRHLDEAPKQIDGGYDKFSLVVTLTNR